MRSESAGTRPGSEPAPFAPLLPVVPVACGLCGGTAARPYTTSYDYEYGTCRNQWHFVECEGCGTVYLNPRPAPEALGAIYPPTYYSYNYDQQIHPMARRAKDLLDRRRFQWMLRQLDPPLQAYCDIGCGDGRYLRLLASMGVARDHIHGTELNADVVRRLVDEGFRVEQATIQDAHRLPVGGLQLVTMFSVLEHVDDPQLTLRKAAELLAPGGLLVAEVPNLRSTNARLFQKRYWGGYHTPRHWNLFTLEALTAAAARAGLRRKTFRRTSGHAFWLYSLHHYLRYEWGWDRLGRWLHPATCLPGVALATAVDLVRARLGAETDNLLVVLERPR